jgi:hypothetical protein
MPVGNVVLPSTSKIPAITSFHYPAILPTAPRVLGQETDMTQIQTFRAGNATGVLIDSTVHVLKRSSSRFHLSGPDFYGQYVCQDGCCDRGLRDDVSAVVRQAKEAGATSVVLRTGQRDYYLSEIHGLKTSDVSGRRGDVGVGWKVTAAW